MSTSRVGGASELKDTPPVQPGRRGFLFQRLVLAILPPRTEFEKEWRTNETAIEGAQLLVARTTEEFAAIWKKHDPKDEKAPTVDFGKWMIVGITTPVDQHLR